MHDWWVTDRIFPPSPLDQGIPFLDHLTVYSILQCSARNHPEGIPVVAQLLEKVVYVDMKALEEEAAMSYLDSPSRTMLCGLSSRLDCLWLRPRAPLSLG